jgi:hypothetical protein
MWEETKEGKRKEVRDGQVHVPRLRDLYVLSKTLDMQVRKTSDGEETYKYNLYDDTELLSMF